MFLEEEGTAVCGTADNSGNNSLDWGTTFPCPAWWDGLRSPLTLLYKDFIKKLELTNKRSCTPLGRIFSLTLSRSKERLSSANSRRISSCVADLVLATASLLTKGRVERVRRTAECPTPPQSWPGRRSWWWHWSRAPLPAPGSGWTSPPESSCLQGLHQCFPSHLWDADLKTLVQKNGKKFKVLRLCSSTTVN